MTKKVNVKCMGCNQPNTIQERNLKIRNINKDQYTCRKCSAAKSRTKNPNLLRILVNDYDRSRTLSSAESLEVRCDYCHRNNQIRLSSIYVNLKNNEGKYRCNTCAYQETKGDGLAKLRGADSKKKISAKSKEEWLKHKDLICSMYRTDQNVDKIASHFSISVAHAYRVLKLLNISLLSPFSERFSKDKIVDAYFNQKMSKTEIANYFNCSSATVDRIFRKHKIKGRSFRDASLIRSKKISRQMKELWKNQDYIQNQLKGCDSIKERMNKISSSQLGKISSIQTMLYSICKDFNVNYQAEVSIGFWSFDCLLTDYNILIECQGDYWHSLKEAVARDKAKASYIKKYFPEYRLIYLWEHEFKCRNKIVEFISKLIGQPFRRKHFSFKDVSVSLISAQKAQLFLSKYHYAGHVSKAGKFYQATIDNFVVAVCGFTPLTRKESAIRLGYSTKEVLELSRFCIHPEYHKKNFASWFMSRCIKFLSKEKLEVKCLVSFADTTYGHNGVIYKAGNWRYDGEVKPSYWYIDKDGYVMHKKTLWDHAKKMGLSEKEYANKHNYCKHNGKKKLRFVWEYD